MKEKKMGTGRYRMNVDLDRDLAKELRKALIDDGKTLSDWVREETVRYLNDWMTRQAGKIGPEGMQ